MRYIPIHDEPPQELLDKAAAVTQQLEDAKTEDERKEIIHRNRNVYRGFHDWLLEKSHGKYWYSETNALFTYFDVEHYRPKNEAKDIDGALREGYWWLAFDWRNLRICGNVGNRKKGTYFPLRDPARAADSKNRNKDQETPYLLDPIRQADTIIVEFSETGAIVPSPEATDWDTERLKLSVKRYRLDFHRLEQRRKAIWQRCQQLINKCQNEMTKLRHSECPVAQDRVDQCFERLREMIQRTEPLSSVAISCLLSSGLRWAARIAASQTEMTGAPQS